MGVSVDVTQRTEKKVFSFMEEYEMILPGDRVVLGISGGADSVCLLFVLQEYRKKVPFFPVVVHVNHGIREDAGKDAEYVEKLCRGMEIPFYLCQGDIKRLAAEEKCSEEDAGRRFRYRAFRNVARQVGASKIAVAHNGNDRAETMLFRLIRGSGLKGLCSIAPVRKDREAGSPEERVVIHPILCLERREVEAYLEAGGIPYCTDITNQGDAYARNRIRHHILACAEEEISSGAVNHMCNTADILTEAEDYLQQQTQEALARCAVVSREPKGRPEAAVDVERFLREHRALQKRMLLSLAEKLSPTGKDISLVHVEDVLDLFYEEKNRQADLPFGLRARREYGKVILEREAEGCPENNVPLFAEVFLPVEGGHPVTVDLGSSGEMIFSVLPVKKYGQVMRNKYTKWFDYDKIKESLVIRSRQTGDFLTIPDREGQMIHKSLKDYMINEKIPGRIRNRIPVLAEGRHVLWLAGYRISEYYKVSRNTKRILQVQLKGGCFDSGTEDEDG